MTSAQNRADIEYLSLLDLTYRVVQALQGKKVTDERLYHCEGLAKKLFFHCCTIYSLSRGTFVQLRGAEQVGCHDFSSIAVLARAALETYLTMFEVFVAPATDDEREFQHECWLLSGFVVRERWQPSSRVAEQFAAAKKDIQQMRSRIKATEVYKRLKPKQREKVLQWGRIGRLRERLAAAGLGGTAWSNEYAYQSGHVHADGLSAVQVKRAATKEEQEWLMQPQMTIAKVAMSKMICDYVAMFPESREVAEANPETYTLAQVLSGAAEVLP